MKDININDTFYTLTQGDDALKEALIEFGFDPMRDPKAYQTMGRIMTLKKALNHIGKTERELIDFLNSKGLEVNIYE